MLRNDTLTVLLGLEQKGMCGHRFYLSVAILMRSKLSNCHLTLNTFMSIAEQCHAFKSGLSFVLIRNTAIISYKKFDILSWKNEMCIFSLLGQSKYCKLENFFFVKVCQTFPA